MGVLINQSGVKVETNNVIEQDNVLMRISKVELHKFIKKALNVGFTILDGPNKGRVVYDAINYDGDFSWKYVQLRKFAEVPYSKDENPNIDIEALLLNKTVKADLSKRVDKRGEDQQTIRYVKLEDGDLEAFNSQQDSNSAAPSTWNEPIDETKDAEYNVDWEGSSEPNVDPNDLPF